MNGINKREDLEREEGKGQRLSPVEPSHEGKWVRKTKGETTKNDNEGSEESGIMKAKREQINIVKRRKQIKQNENGLADLRLGRKK